ncbi:SDR family oxidoreductase [Hwanghaeella grinnelliae]|uniref:SDR family oxidoreductase n=1 Tax=Hwanghaeella grinnelliae TaxID=2500179 RepID=A0A3S2W5P5_9PROT|nr:SDR family NAD(P)-dependent oxidoreductase [Hwanghaeella grinnelliae]RVU37806.1 SDR family oxidoreductase [Hwanghaeella grinnelliae]
MGNKIDLDGKLAVITGGAQGIGYAIAERFIASGASVTLWDRDETLMDASVSKLSANGKAFGCAVDVTTPDAVMDAVTQTRDSMGGIDILVCNAGIAGPAVPVLDYPVDEWNKVINLDLNAVFYCCKAVAPLMVEQNYGRIVNIASIAGKEGNPNASGYSAAKAGVIGFTKSLGKELAKHDIAVNCITPAAARTAIFDQITQQHIDFMLSKIPRERFVLVEEIAAMAAWLSSAENSFTTAGVFDISGGRATY